MTGLSGVTTVHIHLFGISVIDVFFMLPLGLKQYAVQGLCMLMCPLTPAVSNYPWGMEPRLGLQPPAIIWVMAKLHKSFVQNWGKEKKGTIIQERAAEGMEQEVRKGRSGGKEEESNAGVPLFCLFITTLCWFPLFEQHFTAVQLRRYQLWGLMLPSDQNSARR